MGADGFIRIPQWAQPDVSPVEDRVDSALSSANGFLNAILAPVRTFVGWVLHIMFALVDLTVGWVFGVVHWVFDHLAELADGAIRAIDWSLSEARALIDSAVGNAFTSIGNVGHVLEGLITKAVNAVYDVVRGWFDDAIHYASRVADGARDLIAQAVDTVTGFARGWVDDAIHYASRVADGARDLVARASESTLGTVRRWVDDAAGAVRGFVDGAIGDIRQWAGDAVDGIKTAFGALVRDVIDPLVGRFESFIDHEWRWAFDLLKIVEGAAEWLAWITVHAIPETVGVYRFVRDLGDQPVEELFQVGASVADRATK